MDKRKGARKTLLSFFKLLMVYTETQTQHNNSHNLEPNHYSNPFGLIQQKPVGCLPLTHAHQLQHHNKPTTVLLQQFWKSLTQKSTRKMKQWPLMIKLIFFPPSISSPPRSPLSTCSEQVCMDPQLEHWCNQPGIGKAWWA